MPLIQAALLTSHGLQFLSAPYLRAPEWLEFRVGTMRGLWKPTAEAYEILTFLNETPGNGHFQDVMEWFEFSCKRDNRKLIIREVWNQRLKDHFIEKRGFKPMGKDHLVKTFQ